MLAKITVSRQIGRAIGYNEQKVIAGAADRLGASGFLKPASVLTPADMRSRFMRRMELNDRVQISLHITLNFDPRDRIENGTMLRIVRAYMRDIGFARQPWVAWRHHDAGHPHCHLVTTHIRENGDPIVLFNIGKNQSEQSKQRIEREFGLTTSAQKKASLSGRPAHPVQAPRPLKYGDQSLAAGMAKVLEWVIQNYRYTNLDEFNAVLRSYNVEAYRGKPGTRLFRQRGLLYRALDDHGHYIGRPVKASFFDCAPTLSFLEGKFRQNLAMQISCRIEAQAKVNVRYTLPPEAVKSKPGCQSPDEHLRQREGLHRRKSHRHRPRL